MGKYQCRNTLNNLKSNVATAELSGHTTKRTKHPEPDEVEENYLKYNFKMMIETLKVEMKISIK